MALCVVCFLVSIVRRLRSSHTTIRSVKCASGCANSLSRCTMGNFEKERKKVPFIYAGSSNCFTWLFIEHLIQWGLSKDDINPNNDSRIRPTTSYSCKNIQLMLWFWYQLERFFDTVVPHIVCSFHALTYIGLQLMTCWGVIFIPLRY